MLTEETPERITGDKAYDSEKLDQEMVEMIAPHQASRKLENGS
jgi:hypothetical protein